MEHTLQNPYISVEQNGLSSYGGNQSWGNRRAVRKCGCGVIAGTDLLLYLHRNRPDCQAEFFRGVSNSGTIPLEEYNRYVDRLCRGYLPMIPALGLNTFVLAGGLNRYFWKFHVPLRAKWGVRPSQFWRCIQDMLDRDIPVILAVGANVPFPWQQHKVTLYTRSKSGDYLVSCGVKAHYVTVTGLDERYMRASSWGREYYICRTEYMRYVHKHSCCFFSNIAYIKEKCDSTAKEVWP